MMVRGMIGVGLRMVRGYLVMKAELPLKCHRDSVDVGLRYAVICHV